MKIKSIRYIFTDKSTISKLFINGMFFCHVLEDTSRNDIKINNETSIPEGIYEVIINFSSRFQKQMPLLCNIPNFSGIRIHVGNQNSDTSGCLLVGRYLSHDFITDSKITFHKLFILMNNAISSGEKIEIEITHL